MNEMVNHPAHYNAPGRKECIEEMIDKWGELHVALWCEMTAYKYEYRAGTKEGESAELDMAKRDWYLNKAKELRCHSRRKGPYAASAAATVSMPIASDIAAPIANDAVVDVGDVAKSLEESLRRSLSAGISAMARRR